MAEGRGCPGVPPAFPTCEGRSEPPQISSRLSGTAGTERPFGVTQPGNDPPCGRLSSRTSPERWGIWFILVACFAFLIIGAKSAAAPAAGPGARRGREVIGSGGEKGEGPGVACICYLLKFP